MSDESHKLRVMLDQLRKREKNAVEEANQRGASIEAGIDLANGRAVDALLAISTIVAYIIEKESQYHG